MAYFEEQRVGVFVDCQNLYYSAKNLYGKKVNFANILESGVNGRKLIRAFCYVINAEIQGESTFHEALAHIGFDVRAKDLQTFYGGAKKGDWDIGIAMDIMRYANKLDVVVLVSGDGDFQDLLEHVKALGCRTEVIGFGKTSSSKLKNTADFFLDMDRDHRRYLIGGRIDKPKPGAAPVKRMPGATPPRKAPAKKPAARKASDGRSANKK